MNTASPSNQPSAARRLLILGVVLGIGLCLWYLPTAISPDISSEANQSTDSLASVHPMTTVDQTGAAGRQVVGTEPGGWFTAQVGSRFRFRFTTSTQWKIESTSKSEKGPAQMSPTPNGGNSGVDIGGLFTLTILDRRAGEAVAAISLKKFDVSLGSSHGGGDEAIQRLLAIKKCPLLVRFDGAGRIRGYRFSDLLQADQRNLWRGIVGTFEFVVPAGQRKGWQGTGTDTAGTYRAEYEQLKKGPDRLRVRRTKLRYLELSGGPQRMDKCTFMGHSTATLSGELGWLTSARIDEGMRMGVDMLHAEVTLQTVGSLDLTAAEQVVPDQLRRVDWNSPWAAASGVDEDVTAMIDDAERRQWAKRLRDTATSQIVAEMLRMIASAGGFESEEICDLVDAMAWKLRLDPEAAAKLEQAIVANQGDAKMTSILMYALTKAGTARAQDVLLSSYLANEAQHDLQEASVFAMHQLAEPTEVLLAAVAHRASGRGANGKPDRMSMLLYGSLAPRAEAPAAGGRSAMQALLAMEGQALKNGALSTWLEALGNAGTAAIVPSVVKYLPHQEESVRMAAVSALRSVHTTPARDSLLVRASSDQSGRVRAFALENLGTHQLTGREESLHRLAQADRAADVRKMALKLIWLGGEADSRGRGALRRAAAEDKDAKVREFATTLLRRKSDS